MFDRLVGARVTQHLRSDPHVTKARRMKVQAFTFPIV